MAPLGCWTSCVRPAIGSLATITFGEPPARATEIVSPFGDSNETSSVPACVTIIDGTTMFCDAARERGPGSRRRRGDERGREGERGEGDAAHATEDARPAARVQRPKRVINRRHIVL